MLFLLIYVYLYQVQFHVLTICATWWESYKKQELPILREHLWSPPIFARISVAHLFSFLCCAVLYALFVFILCLVCPMLPMSLDCPSLLLLGVSPTSTCIGQPIVEQELLTIPQHLSSSSVIC